MSKMYLNNFYPKMRIIDDTFNYDFKCEKGNESTRKILEYLKGVLDLEDLKLSQIVDPNALHYNEDRTLYKLAKQIHDFLEGDCAYDPFTDYPLCDSLEDFYNDFNELCGEIGELLVDKSQIDLSDLDGLKRDLAKEVVQRELFYYKEDVDDYLNANPLYEDKCELLKDLFALENKLCFSLEVEYSCKENKHLDINSIELSSESRKQIKDFLRKNPDFDKGDDEFYSFTLDEIREELLQEQQKKMKGKQKR